MTAPSKDILKASWDFAVGIVKDPSTTLSDTIAGVQKSFTESDPMRWVNASFAGIGITAIGLGLTSNNPVLVALGIWDITMSAGRFQEIGERERTRPAAAGLSGPWGPIPKDDGLKGPDLEP